MRVSLTPGTEEFEKQLRDVRRFLRGQERKGGQPAVSARLMAPCYPPFLAALRNELREDEVVPDLVLVAAADLIANVAVTAVESLFNTKSGEPDLLIEVIERILNKAHATAVVTLEAGIKPAPEAGGDNVVPFEQKH